MDFSANIQSKFTDSRCLIEKMFSCGYVVGKHLCFILLNSRKFYFSVTHRCHNKKGAGCYSFNLTDKGLDPDEVGSIELWIYKQQDLNDHHIQVGSDH